MTLSCTDKVIILSTTSTDRNTIPLKQGYKETQVLATRTKIWSLGTLMNAIVEITEPALPTCMLYQRCLPYF